MSGEIAYSIVQKVVTDKAFMQALIADPDGTITKEGITDPAEAMQLKQALIPLLTGMRAGTQAGEMNALLLDQLKSTLETANRMKSGLRDTVDQIESGFRYSMVMYMVAFYLGVLLILGSAVLVVVRGDSLLPAVFGTLGIADVITYFVTRPPQNLQASRADLTQLQLLFFNWFNDFFNWNSYLSDLAKAGKVDYNLMHKVSTTMLENTDKTMSLIEQYCELTKK